MSDLDASVKDIRTTDGYQWEDVCARFGTALKGKESGSSRARRSLPPGDPSMSDPDVLDNPFHDPYDWPLGAQDFIQDVPFPATTSSVSNDPRAAAAAAAGFPYENADNVDLSSFDFSGIFDAGSAGGPGGAPALFGNRANNLVNLLATPDTCLYRNILDIWQSNGAAINKSQPLDIIRDVNAALEKRSVCRFMIGFLFQLCPVIACCSCSRFPTCNSSRSSNNNNKERKR